jgi:hypothetical protein
MIRTSRRIRQKSWCVHSHFSFNWTKLRPHFVYTAVTFLKHMIFVSGKVTTAMQRNNRAESYETRRFYLVALIWLATMTPTARGFLAPQIQRVTLSASLVPTFLREGSKSRLYFFGGPKDDGTPGDYVCQVCSNPHGFSQLVLRRNRAPRLRLSPSIDHTARMPHIAISVFLNLYLCNFGHCNDLWWLERNSPSTLGLWVCIYQRSSSVGCLARQLVLSTLRISETPV